MFNSHTFSKVSYTCTYIFIYLRMQVCVVYIFPLDYAFFYFYFTQDLENPCYLLFAPTSPLYSGISRIFLFSSWQKKQVYNVMSLLQHFKFYMYKHLYCHILNTHRLKQYTEANTHTHTLTLQHNVRKKNTHET